MSLLSDNYEPCAYMVESKYSDGVGGHLSTWARGRMFSAAIVLDSSSEARIAAAQGLKNLYTVVTPREIQLNFNDIFKRLSDGKTFRVISDGTDKKTPASASLDMRVVTAQEFELPTNE